MVEWRAIEAPVAIDFRADSTPRANSAYSISSSMA